MYKRRNLGYNSWSMAAMRSVRPSANGDGDARKGRRGQRALLVTIAVFVSFMVIDAFVGERGLAALVRTRQQYKELAMEVALKQAENGRLRERNRRLRAPDPAAIGRSPAASTASSGPASACSSSTTYPRPASTSLGAHV